MNIQRLSQNIKVCEEALYFAQELFGKGNTGEAESLLHDVQILASTITTQLKEDQERSSFSKRAMLCSMNMEDSLNRFFCFPLKQKRILNYEILVSFYKIQQFAKWQYEILNSPESLQKYREESFQILREAHAQPSSKKKYKYKVSIIVTAYNKLEYTKLAIESIFKHTDFTKGDVELITIDNGSSDGTEDYFESLPHEKKIHHKYNMIGNPHVPFLYEGEYVISFSNDVVATPRWMEQLIFCMESSPDIAMIVPTCNKDAISANQGVAIPYENNVASIAQIEEFAEKYNSSDSHRWEERMAVMPFVSVWKNSMTSLPIIDPGFSKAQFIDDDFSTTLRRTGWKMVLAKDTFLHHFGSITLGDSKIASNHNAFQEMRQVYFEKWGVDAWESRGALGIEFTFQWIFPKKKSRILWIEPKFGMDFLQMKNYYRQKGFEDMETYAIILDPRYKPDAEYYFDHCIFAEDFLQTISDLEGGYDLIGMGAYLHEIVDGSAIDVLERLYSLLKPGGHLLVPIRNFSSASNLEKMIRAGGSVSWGLPANTFKGLSLWGVLNELSRHNLLKDFSRVSILESSQALCMELHSRLHDLFSDVCNTNDFEQIMKIALMWLDFRKK